MGGRMRDMKRFELPVPSTSFTRDPILTEKRGGEIAVEIEHKTGNRADRSQLVFTKPRVYCRRAESHCTEWHIGESYDAVSEVLESEWVDTVRRETAKGWRDTWVMRHFKIYFDGWGCLEVICESFAFEEGSKASTESEKE
jgi:hypothetical protein